MPKPKPKLTKVEKAAKQRRKRETMIICLPMPLIEIGPATLWLDQRREFRWLR